MATQDSPLHISRSHPYLGCLIKWCIRSIFCWWIIWLCRNQEPLHPDEMPEATCESSNFCCSLQNTNGVPTVTLRKSDNYYCQVEGQMGVGSRPWCDFVVYTNKGLSVERIFDSEFWNHQLVPKLEEFYTNALVATQNRQLMTTTTHLQLV